MRLWTVIVAVILPSLLIIPSGVFADTYTDLQDGTDATEEILQMNLDQHAADQAEITIESSDEFFPASGSGSSSSRRGGDISASPFVTFRLQDVTYALTDVPLTAWFAPYVRDVADQGIVSGYRDGMGVPTGIFGPERPVSIEELAKMAVEAADLPLSLCTDPPENPAAQGSWSASYIRCAERGNFAVYADGTVAITRPATRGEVIMTVLQAFGVALRDSPPPDVTLKDVTASTLFSSAIFTALEGGIVAGDTDAQGNRTGTFRPGSPINRAEVSKIISLAVQLYGK